MMTLTFSASPRNQKKFHRFSHHSHRGGQQGRQADDGGALGLGTSAQTFGGHIRPRSVTSNPASLEHVAHEVFSDIMQIALHRADHHLAGAEASPIRRGLRISIPAVMAFAAIRTSGRKNLMDLEPLSHDVHPGDESLFQNGLGGAPSRGPSEQIGNRLRLLPGDQMAAQFFISDHIKILLCRSRHVGRRRLNKKGTPRHPQCCFGPAAQTPETVSGASIR